MPATKRRPTQDPPPGLFGYGLRGLPDEIDRALGKPGAVEAMAEEIREKWTNRTRQRTIKSQRDVSQRLDVEIGTLASILLWFHVRRSRAPSETVAAAIDLALGVVSPYSKQPVPSADVLGRFGIPTVDDMEAFLEASKLDGEADRTGKPISQRRLAALTGKSQSTIKLWRANERYVSRRKFVAGIGAG